MIIFYTKWWFLEKYLVYWSFYENATVEQNVSKWSSKKKEKRRKDKNWWKK